MAESFFSSLKLELVQRRPWATRAQARRAIFEYIEVFYNRRRLHSSLGYLTRPSTKLGGSTARPLKRHSQDVRRTGSTPVALSRLIRRHVLRGAPATTRTEVGENLVLASRETVTGRTLGMRWLRRRSPLLPRSGRSALS